MSACQQDFCSRDILRICPAAVPEEAMEVIRRQSLSAFYHAGLRSRYRERSYGRYLACCHALTQLRIRFSRLRFITVNVNNSAKKEGKTRVRPAQGVLLT
jgi:hypothetical protein